MPPIKKRKNTSLNYEQKRAICEHHEQNPLNTQVDLMLWVENTIGLSVSQSTISNVLSQKDKYLFGAGYTNPKQHRERPVRHQQMDERLGTWFIQTQERVALSGDNIKDKGQRILSGFDHNLKFSNGWLARFKRRHAIRSYRRHGEAASVNEEKLQADLPRLREALNRFDWENIYNMDETGLYYRAEVSARVSILLDR